MKRLLFSLLPALLMAAEPDAARIKSLVEDARKAWEVPGVGLAIVQGDRTLYLAGHGLREVGKPEPLTEHSLFQIASLTKAFTSAGIAMMVDEGKMAWDDPVRKHLDYFHLSDPHADSLVTIRDIASHRTGLPRHDVLWIRTGFTRENLIRRMAFAKPTAPFRSLYQYQNLMFTSAGESLGHASGLGWDAFLKQRIFTPLGMTDSLTVYADMARVIDRAMPHTKDKTQLKVAQWGNYDNIGGAGCIASSVNDLSHWLRLQLASGAYDGKRLVSEKNLNETRLPNMVIRLTPPTSDLQPDFTQSTYGMGWQINHYRGEMLVMHSGSLNGFRALVTMVPRLKLGFVVLTNLNGTNLNEALTDTLLDEYLGLPKARDWNAHMLSVVKRNEERDAREKLEKEEERKKDTKPSLPLSAYVGLYREPAYGDAKVIFQDGKLIVEWARTKGEMEHWHFDTWRLKDGIGLADTMATFTLDAKGVPSKLTLLGQDFLRQ